MLKFNNKMNPNNKFHQYFQIEKEQLLLYLQKNQKTNHL
jgi:hypothetical protein